jgi:nitrate reductase NapD
MTGSRSRRDLLTGAFADRTHTSTGIAEIVSLIVNVFPAHMDSVSEAIANMPGAEVHGQDPKGKLIVVLEASTQGAIGAMADAISGLPNVISAAMVFQATDEAGV